MTLVYQTGPLNQAKIDNSNYTTLNIIFIPRLKPVILDHVYRESERDIIIVNEHV